MIVNEVISAIRIGRHYERTLRVMIPIVRAGATGANLGVDLHFGSRCSHDIEPPKSVCPIVLYRPVDRQFYVPVVTVAECH